MKTKRGLLGFYNYTVILTYIGMLTAFGGIALALNGRFRQAVICLMVAGVCDMFDGTVASTMERCAAEKRFGIQIDSLCDLICFGVFPGLIVYILNGQSNAALGVAGVYVLCALIRLAYFNVLEEERQEQTSEARSRYLGLPVTTVALLLPALFGLDKLGLVPVKAGSLVLLGAMALAFVLPIPIKKPHSIGRIGLLAAGILEFCVLMIGAS